MNKFIATICASAIILSSCSNDTVISSAPAPEISYGVVTNNHSRAADSYGTENLPSSFKVWAIAPDNTLPYIDGHTIVQNGNSWNDDAGVQNWPQSKLNFFAVVNDGGTFALNNGAPKLNNFTVKDNASEQTDVLYAVAYECTSEQPNVQIEFNHALAQIGFRATCPNSSLSVVVRSVAIGHIGNCATFTFPSANKTAGSWSEPTGETTYKVTLNPEITVAIGDKATNLTNNIADVLMLLPQTVHAWTPKENGSYDGAYFLVGCTIKDKNNGTVLRDGEIAIPVEVNWEAGKRYVYTFSFSSHSGGYTPDPEHPDPVLVPIGYSVKVEGFQNATDTGDVTI